MTWGSQFSTTGNVTVPALITTNNGSGFNVKIGDDVWLGDVNVGDTMSIRGVSTPTNGYIIFGSSNETALGRSGTGPLTYGGAFSASGNVTGGNVLTGGLISATSTITSAANITGGNVLTGGLISATANITGGNVLTGGLISATGNITGGNVNTNNLVGTAITITSTGALNLTPTGNITVNNKNINNLADPVADQDAATKAYVDAFAQGLNIHDAVYAATTTTLATTTSGTITYNNGSSGVGATLTTTGTFNLIDTANVQTANTRILVKNEANAVTNGVYVWSNATAITRASDYNTVPEVEAGDFMFVLNGNVYGNTAWVQTSTVTGIGTVGNNIVFTQFAAAAEYTGNTSAGISIVGTVISALVDNTTTAFDGSGNISVKAGAQLTTPNIGAATGTSLSTTANITGGNINTGGLISATGNITGGNVLTVGLMSATGNISANYFIGNGSLLTGISGGGSYSNANVAAYLPTYPGNLVSLTGPVTTTGNITGDYIYGNGYYLTGILGGTNIAPLAGTVDNFTGNGVQTNFTLSTTPTSVNLIFVNVNGVYQLPAAYSLSTNVLTMTSAVPNGAVLSVTQLSGGGIANSLVNGSSNIVVAASGNISMSAAGTANVAVVASNGLYLTGTITVNTGNAATAIVNGAANGVGNIGSSTTYFDTVFAKATSAQYADLAEMYVSDFGYVPGTVVVFGGEQEVTLATTTDDHRVAGVVSTNPSYLMNSIQQGEYVIPVALTGRVPCKVTGTIRKGDLMVTAGNGHAYANNRAQSGTIIGKALENHSGESGVIEVVVGTR